MAGPSEIPEFLSAVSSATDAESALRGGVARIAEAFDAEVAAIVHRSAVLASVGFPRGSGHHGMLLAAVRGDVDELEVPGLDPVRAAVVDVDDDTVVLIARTDDPLSRTELAHAQAMGRVLTMTLRLLETVGRERMLREITEVQIAENEALLVEHRSHQRMLEAILRAQRLISRRHPVDSILEAITDEAVRLLDADVVGICIAGTDGVRRRALSAQGEVGHRLVRGISPATLENLGRRAAGDALTGQHTIETGGSTASPAPAGVIGTPIHAGSTPIGGLYLISASPIDPADFASAAPMQTFASQAGIALVDASTVDELHHAFHDTLTGLPNRALFLDRLDHALALGERRDTVTALLFLDLDRFKVVNDTLGHAAGDELLRQIGACISAGGRAYDSSARLGGDEFAILLEDSDEREALQVARRLLEQIEQISSRTDSVARASVSIGVAVTGTGCRTGDELLRRADIAMYSVKANGRAGAASYHAAMGRTRLDQGSMTAALERALERDEFVVHYQPVMSLSTRTVTGVEALVRWLDPQHGLVPPERFIQAAEDSGLIVPIGARVLELACDQAARWRREIRGAEELVVSVNLSGRQLEHDRITDTVQSVLETTGLDPWALVLEVTESIFLSDAEASGAQLRELKHLGLQLAIDDFGTGFSSLSYVQNYPFDILKIDRSFVRDLGTGSNRGAVLRTMLTLGQQLSMLTVAEGIESPVELAQLRALRCTHGQGFLFSRPVDAEKIERLLSSHVVLADVLA